MKIKNILKFAAYTTAFTAVYNKTVAVLATTYNCLKTSDGDYYEWDYGKVFYTKKGEGTPVLLLHDLTSASSGYEWSKVEDELAKNHTVYIPDLPGCGRSDKPGFSYSNFLYVKFLTSFLKEVVGEQCTIITTGKSSSFALLGSSFSTDLVSRIICINPANPNGLDQAKSLSEKVINGVLSVPIYGTALYNHYQSQDKIKKLFTENYLYEETEDLKEMVTAYHEAAHRKLRFARNFYASERLNYCVLPVKHVLSSVNIPIEVIIGDHEDNAEEISQMYKAVNDAITVSTIEDSKHLPQLENPDQLIDFFSHI